VRLGFAHQALLHFLKRILIHAAANDHDRVAVFILLLPRPDRNGGGPQSFVLPYITLFSLGLGVMPGILPLLAIGLPSTS